MSRWFGVDVRCDACGTTWSELFERERKDEAQTCTCPGCLLEEPRTRLFSAPSLMVESLPDGQRRKNDGNYNRMREAIKLETKAYNHPPDSKERKELMKAAHETKTSKGKLT